MSTAAIFQLAILALPLIQTGVTTFIKWLSELRGALQQSGEWTDAQEQAYRTAVMLKVQDPAYQPDDN